MFHKFILVLEMLSMPVSAILQMENDAKTNCALEPEWAFEAI